MLVHEGERRERKKEKERERKRKREKECCELNLLLVCCRLHNKLGLLLLKLRPLSGDHDPKQLVLQPLHGDHEVEQGYLRKRESFEALSQASLLSTTSTML